MIYVISYVLKSEIVDGKFDLDKITSLRIKASDATRAISAAKRELVEKGTIEAEGDIKVLEAKLGVN